jgi:hypothetical protein
MFGKDADVRHVKPTLLISEALVCFLIVFASAFCTAAGCAVTYSASSLRMPRVCWK